MNDLMSKKSLDEFSEKDLLKLVLSNQIVIIRRMERLFEKMEGVTPRDLGNYSDTFGGLVRSSLDVLRLSNEFLRLPDEEKGSLKL